MTTYERKGHTITTIKKDEEGKVSRSKEVFRGGRDGRTPSVNAAKRASRKLQLETNKHLGGPKCPVRTVG